GLRAWGVTCDLEAPNLIRQSIRGQWGRRVHDMEVQVRYKRVTGVAYEADHLSCLDVVALMHLQTSWLHVCVERVAMVPQVEHDGISVGFFNRDVGRILAGRLLRLAVNCGNDGGVGRGQGLLAEDGIAFQFLLWAVVDAVL